MSWAIYELVAQRDAADLRARLAIEGCAIRHLDGAGVADGGALQARAAEAFGYDATDNWDAFADRIWMAILPQESEGEKSALVWEHADELLAGDLNSFLMAFDVLISAARQAYEEVLDVTIFLLGDGPGFPPLH